MNERLNDLAYWFPILQQCGVPVPRTEIIKTDCELIRIFDGENPDGFVPLCNEINIAAEKLRYPVFLRSGQTSAKHEWVNTCLLKCKEDIAQHVGNIVEYGEIASFCGLPYDTWVVRELLPVASSGFAFREMPVTIERRYFIEGGKVTCHHPYWPAEAFESYPKMISNLAAMNLESDEEVEELSEMSRKVSNHFDGAWSLDWLKTERGWFAIDMALASDSYHWSPCDAR